MKDIMEKNENLIDHTGLHSLYQRESVKPEEIPAIAREIFYFIEVLLLSRHIWISNTDGNETIVKSKQITNLLSKCGFREPDGNELITFTSFSDEEVEEFGNDVLSLAIGTTCQNCGTLPGRNRGTHFGCPCGLTKLMPLTV